MYNTQLSIVAYKHLVIYFQSTTKDDTAAFMKTLKNNLSRKQRRKAAVKYLPIEAESQYTNPAWYAQFIIVIWS